ncbi:MAG: hypothetical protein AAFX79_04675 [Planctomycetota bacterium]
MRAAAARVNALRGRPAIRVAGFVLGAGLVVAAIVAALWQNPDGLREAYAAMRARPAWEVVALFALPALNWLVIATSLWVLTERFGRLGWTEMTGLIGLAWLLNYLPMRPGLVSRVTYHKMVNGIRVRESARALAEGAASTAISAGVLLAVALLLRGVPAGVAWLAMAIGPVVLGGFVASSSFRARPLVARYAIATGLRSLDMTIWAARYALAFGVIGVPIDASGAMALAIASQLAMLVPIAGNGLGLREWMIGALASGALTTAAVAGGGIELGQGLTADVLNRAAEVLVSIPVGLLGLALTIRRLRRHRRGGASERGQGRSARASDANV